VYVEEEDVGVVVTIEDSGLGMRKRERGRAEELIAQPFSLATLPVPGWGWPSSAGWPTGTA